MTITLKNGTRKLSNEEANMLLNESTRKVTVIEGGYEYTFDNQDSSEFTRLLDVINAFIDKGLDFGCDLMTFTPHVKPRINLNVHHGVIHDELNGPSAKEPDYWTLKINL